MQTTTQNLDSLVLDTILAHAVGRHNAMTTDAIAASIGVPSTRENVAIRAGVRRLRLQGIPVMAAQSAPKGYFLATTITDIVDFRQSYSDRMAEMQEVVDVLDYMIANWPGDYPDN